VNAPRILVAGIGNIFLGDDAFGVEVARRLVARRLPDGVRAADFGIRGLDLAYALLEGWDTAILVDAVARGQSPGTLFVLEPQPDPADGAGPAASLIEAHSMDPAKVLRLVRAMGGRVGRMLVVGCEPAPLAPDEMSMEISGPVQASLDEAVTLVESLVARSSDPAAHETNASPVPAATPVAGEGSWDTTTDNSRAAATIGGEKAL
jgi:hydrogenase maturation protease